MLIPKQQRFVDEYLIDLNATQAAIRAGYSAKTAQEQGSRLLSNVMVAGAIAERQGKRLATSELTAARVLEEVRRLALGDIGELFDDNGKLRNIKDLPPEVRAMIASVEVVKRSELKVHDDGEGETSVSEVEYIHKVKLWDKGAQLANALKHFGLLVTKHEHEVGPKLEALIAESMKKPDER